jgi:hypothetical protein
MNSIAVPSRDWTVSVEIPGAYANSTASSIVPSWALSTAHGPSERASFNAARFSHSIVAVNRRMP